MYKNNIIVVIIPALNEELALPYVIKDIPSYVDKIFVVDNGSTDRTSEVAKESGVIVLREERKGYGWACLKAIEQLTNEDIVVFLDGDYSDYPDKMDLLLDPIIDNNYDVVISNRFNDELEESAMTYPQQFGNKLAVLLIKLFWNFSYDDLGPFRSITTQSLKKLNMTDKNYGWTIELQIKAIQQKLKIDQVDVPYRKRQLGESKVSSTLKGVILAAYKIIGLIFYYKLGGISKTGSSI